jgi:hypothetical protein
VGNFFYFISLVPLSQKDLEQFNLPKFMQHNNNVFVQNEGRTEASTHAEMVCAFIRSELQNLFLGIWQLTWRRRWVQP